MNGMYNVNDIVMCQSGDGVAWVGYITDVYSDGDLKIKWWNKRTCVWHPTRKFKPSPEDKLDVIGPLPWNVEFDDNGNEISNPF